MIFYDKNDIVCIISPPVAAGHCGQFIFNALLNRTAVPDYYLIVTIVRYVDYCWASEASPTLGCSIEISRDIYICCRYVVCQINCVGGNTWPTRMLKVI